MPGLKDGLFYQYPIIIGNKVCFFESSSWFQHMTCKFTTFINIQKGQKYILIPAFTDGLEKNTGSGLEVLKACSCSGSKHLSLSSLKEAPSKSVGVRDL